MWEINNQLKNLNIKKYCGLLGRKDLIRIVGKRGLTNWLIHEGILLPLLVEKKSKRKNFLFSPGVVLLAENFLKLRAAGRTLKSIKRQLLDETRFHITLKKESAPAKE